MNPYIKELAETLKIRHIPKVKSLLTQAVNFGCSVHIGPNNLGRYMIRKTTVLIDRKYNTTRIIRDSALAGMTETALCLFLEDLVDEHRHMIQRDTLALDEMLRGLLIKGDYE